MRYPLRALSTRRRRRRRRRMIPNLNPDGNRQRLAYTRLLSTTTSCRQPGSSPPGPAPRRRAQRSRHMLSDGLFFRSLALPLLLLLLLLLPLPLPFPLPLFLPNIVPRTRDTEWTPSFRRIGRARRSCTDRASRNRPWNARAAPAGLSAALTS